MIQEHEVIMTRRLAGKANGKDRSGWATVGRQGAAVFRDHPMRERESDTVAMGLGGEERNKDLLQVGGWNTRTGVAN